MRSFPGRRFSVRRFFVLQHFSLQLQCSIIKALLLPSFYPTASILSFQTDHLSHMVSLATTSEKKAKLHFQLLLVNVANDMQTLHYECYYKILTHTHGVTEGEGEGRVKEESKREERRRGAVCQCTICMHLNDSIYHKMAAQLQKQQQQQQRRLQLQPGHATCQQTMHDNNNDTNNNNGKNSNSSRGRDGGKEGQAERQVL